jgi:hypothetical protein
MRRGVGGTRVMARIRLRRNGLNIFVCSNVVVVKCGLDIVK